MKTVVPFAAVGIALAILASASSSMTSAAGSTIQSQAIEFLADVTLIDAQCRSLNATFGMAFTYAEGRGVHATDIMPLGARRAEFQAAYDRRARSTPHDELCGSLARRYDQEFPGLLTAR